MSDLSDITAGGISSVEDQIITNAAKGKIEAEAIDAALECIRERILNLPPKVEKEKPELSIKKKKSARSLRAKEIPSETLPETPLETPVVQTEKKARKITVDKKTVGKSKRRSLKVTLTVEKDAEAPLQKPIEAPFKRGSSNEATAEEKPSAVVGSSLLQELDPLKGPFLEKLAHLKNPIQSEQLVDLCTALSMKNKPLSFEEKEKIFRFALQVAKENGENRASSQLSQLIVLLDNASKDEILSGIKDESKFGFWLSKKFSEYLKHSFEKLNELKLAHKKTGLQDSNISARNYLPVLLANLMISSSGRVNLGIIDELSNEMSQAHIFPDQYKQDLQRLFEELKGNQRLRDKIALIKGPKSEDAPASVVIRASLGMGPNEQITEIHAKRCALAALASHLRQGNDGSCFATPLEIVLLSSRPELCLNDFSSLLESNTLTRKTNHVTRDFPFLLHLSGNRLEKMIIVSRDGSINPETQSGGYLYEAPGIIAACHAIGIESPKKAILEILLAHFNVTEEPLMKLSLKHLLEKLVIYAKSLEANTHKGIGPLFLKASFAFESQEVNPLLQVWGNAIAGMAEPDETGMVLSAIINSVLTTLKIKLKELYPENPLLRKMIRTEIKKELGERVHLQYDPVILTKDESEDKRSKEGAFVLYDKHCKNNPQEWTRVDNPHSFQDFIHQIVVNAKTGLLQEPGNSKEAELVRRAMDKLALYTTTDYFTISALKQYYDRNKEYSDPIKHFEEIKYAPWVTKSGNDFSKVIQVYFEEFNSSNSLTFAPKNVKDLLLKVIDIGKSVKTHGNGKADHSSHQLVPVRIQNVHAFNILLSHPSMSVIWNQSDAFSNWLNRKFLLPGKQIAELPLSAETKAKMITAIVKEIIPKEMEMKVAKEMNKLEEGLPLREFREKAVNLAFSFLSPKQITKEDLSNQIDMLLLEALPDDVRTCVKESALHFADTNWSDGVHDIHLCFLINPGSGDLEIWAVYDDNQKFFPINKNQWITGKKWEFFIEVACDCS